MARPVALITGGARGIGAATAKRLAADGYDVLLTYNTSSKPAEMVVDEIRERGDDALAVKVDCANTGEVGLLGIHPWMARGIDVLVLNHGAYDRVAAQDMTMEDLRRTMLINFEGAVSVWKAVQAHLTRHARMVVVSSQLGTRGSPHGADYSASKAALARLLPEKNSRNSSGKISLGPTEYQGWPDISSASSRGSGMRLKLQSSNGSISS